jgi:hypothetical protein
MKLKKSHKLKFNFIKFELIKLKILQRYSDKFILKSKIEQLTVLLKKALKVISGYHKKRKKILFIGVPQKTQSLYKHKLKRTKHTFLPESYSTTDILTNKFITLKDLKDKHSSHGFNETRIKLAKNRFLLKKRFDLIVVVNSTSLLPLIKKEVLKLKIPMVVLTREETGITEGNFYLIPGELSYDEKLRNFFLLLLLKPIFQRYSRPYMKFKEYRSHRKGSFDKQKKQAKQKKSKYTSA